MVSQRAYLDWNASAPLSEVARATAVTALDLAGNASSVHEEGRKLRQIIEQARRNVAILAGGNTENVVFTSGATEAASTLLTPDWRMGRGDVRLSHLYVCAADHPCTLNGGRFAPGAVTRIGVDWTGRIDLVELRAALNAHDRSEGLPLVAVHLVNNETGVIQPAAELNSIVNGAGGVLVLDAVQAAGRMQLSVGMADFLILSAHKIGGPKGAGAFVGRSSLMMPASLVTGGGQEKGFRAGTENVAAIAGFGAAAREAAEGLARMDSIGQMRDRVEAMVLRAAPRATIYGAEASRVANTTFFSLPGIKSETAQIAFDLAGVAVSAGSACSSGKVGPSHVLQAMGFGDSAGALRVSIGVTTGEEEIALFEKALNALVARSEKTRAVA